MLATCWQRHPNFYRQRTKDGEYHTRDLIEKMTVIKESEFTVWQVQQPFLYLESMQKSHLRWMPCKITFIFLSICPWLPYWLYKIVQIILAPASTLLSSCYLLNPSQDSIIYLRLVGKYSSQGYPNFNSGLLKTIRHLWSEEIKL